MYLARHIEHTLLEAVQQFPAVALSGPRQTGKSTLLKHLFTESFDYVSLDDMALRNQARKDPQTFLRNYPDPLIIDEVQYAPELFPEIKRRADLSGLPGQFILSGSQQFHLIQNLQESLAGRVLLMNLLPMTQQERNGNGGDRHWLPNLLQKGTLEREDVYTARTDATPDTLIRHGGLPGLLNKTESFFGAYFESYLRTYIERDISLMIQLENSSRMVEFLQLLAPLSMRETNKSQLGRDIGMTSPTANRWLQVLEATGVWHNVPAFHGNLIKRIAKTPKGTLFDSGLICHLLQINSREALLTHPLLGFLFEAAFLQEVKAVLAASLLNARVYHWRASQREVDFVIEYGGKLFAFECKWNATLRGDEHKDLLRFRSEYGDKVAFSAVVTSTGTFRELESGIFQIPWVSLPGSLVG
jgi:predicted AAA+ superfamily ATPase